MWRQQRRAAEREGRRYFERHGIPPTRDIVPLILQTRKLIGVLSNERNERRASDAAELAFKGLDTSIANHPTEVSLDCRKGCSFCCYSMVVASAPEVFRIAQIVRQRAGERLAATVQHIGQAHQATVGRDEDGRLQERRPCALLLDGICTVYPVRPLVCRAMASHTVAACESAFSDGVTNIPVPASMFLLKDAHAYCLLAALRACGLSINTYELNHAIWTVLNAEHAEERWLAGGDIFDGVDTRQPPEVGFLETLIAAARGH